ncbi:hypothetical protein [Gordonia humi]|uniref:Serine hydrolase n=1 Tax=Gordonia humi TaxID=686429 RepID=A0A840EZJ7_9ACTN|nr:hypothetical protein [Gordonia humi]MBB4135663.1 hypothetical protein [Gordonia humi]
MKVRRPAARWMTPVGVAVFAVLVATCGFLTSGSAAPTGDGVVGSPADRAARAATLAGAQSPSPGSSTRIGAVVVDRHTGEVAVSGAADEPMFTASLAKLMVAASIVDGARRAGVPVDPYDVDLIGRALGPSDDLAMNELWVRFDGVDVLRRLDTMWGLRQTAPPVDGSFWGATTTTAREVARVFDNVLGLPEFAREIVLGPMESAPPVAADGFDQLFGLRSEDLDSFTTVKQGWMCCLADTAHLHSAGVVGTDRRFIVVLVSRTPQTTATDWNSMRAALSAAALSAVNALGAEVRRPRTENPFAVVALPALRQSTRV